MTDRRTKRGVVTTCDYGDGCRTRVKRTSGFLSRCNHHAILEAREIAHEWRTALEDGSRDPVTVTVPDLGDIDLDIYRVEHKLALGFLIEDQLRAHDDER